MYSLFVFIKPKLRVYKYVCCLPLFLEKNEKKKEKTKHKQVQNYSQTVFLKLIFFFFYGVILRELIPFTYTKLINSTKNQRRVNHDEHLTEL